MQGQLIPETQWELARHGKFTGSESAPLFVEVSRPMTKDELKAREKGNRKKTIIDPSLFSDGALTYIEEKVSEIITGTYRAIETFATEWGKTYEPEAALRIREKYGDFIYYGKENPLFIDYTEWSGCSVDGLIPSERAISEIKCPENPAKHVKYCKINDSESLKKLFPDCWSQMQFNMVVAAQYWGVDPMTMKGLFVSYNPIVDKKYKLFHSAWIKPEPGFVEAMPRVIEKATKELFNQVKMMKDE